MWAFAASLYFVAVFHRMALGVAALEAESRYHVGAGALSAFTAVQLLVYLTLQVPVGLAADRIGPRRSLAAGMAAIAVGEIVFALSHTLPGGLLGRALVGMGDAFVFVNVLRVTHTWFEPRRAALLTGLTGLMGALGQLVTTVPAHVALDNLGWAATFAGAAGVTALLAVAAFAVLRDGPSHREPAPAHDSVAATLRAAWAERGTRLAFWAHFGLMTPFVTMTALWGFPWLVEAQGLGRGTAATWLAAAVMVMAAAAPVAGRLGGRGPGMQLRIALVVTSVLVVAWSVVLAWPGAMPPHAIVLATLMITATGGSVAIVAFMLARESNPPHVAGSASGLVNCGGFLAGSAAVLATGLLLGQLGRSAAGFQHALVPMLALSAIALLQMIRLRRAEPSGVAVHRRAGAVQPASAASGRSSSA